jgi:hypothetical protein
VCAQFAACGSSHVSSASPPGPSDAGIAPGLYDASAIGADPNNEDASTSYAQTGPYGATMMVLNQGLGTVSGGSSALLPLGNGNDPSGFTLFYPEGGAVGERLPLLTWGNGTVCSPTFYTALIDHVVSFGFIVVGANTSNVGTGAEMLQAIDWALAQDKDPSSPIYARVDGNHIGAFGHSQGAAGTVLVGADPRVHAIAPLSGAPRSGTQDASVQIQCPTFYVTTQNDIATPASIRQAYEYTPTPSVFGVTNGGNHDEYTNIADDPHVSGLTSNDGLRVRAAIAAWFDWQLKGKIELLRLFVGQNCGFCTDPNWMTFESKGF